MKTARKNTGVSHEQRMKPLRDDSYHDPLKHPDPACCPRCHACYLRGRWAWTPAPEAAAVEVCPACRRIEDDFPAGYVTIKGAFLAAHREEILNVVRARAERAGRERPLQRIMTMRDVGKGVVVTTTDAHLARGIGVALRDSFKGELELTFSRDENLVRATWTRQ